MLMREALAALAACAWLAGCAGPAREAGALGGDPGRGAMLIVRYGCAGCHEIPGIGAARGEVGPPLDGMGERVFIAGRVPNTPANLSRWVRRAQDVLPGGAMPNIDMGEQDSRDIAAYLHTLR